jgi:hypothetical protein
MTMLILVGGAAILAYFAVLVGISMDTQRQRVTARQVAAERRALQEERWAALEHQPGEPVLIGARERIR